MRPGIPANVAAIAAAPKSKPVHASRQKLLAQEKRAIAKEQLKGKPKAKGKSKASAKNKAKPKGKAKAKAKAKSAASKAKQKTKKKKKYEPTNWLQRKTSFIKKLEGPKNQKEAEDAWKGSEVRASLLATMSAAEIKRRRYDR